MKTIAHVKAEEFSEILLKYETVQHICSFVYLSKQHYSPNTSKQVEWMFLRPIGLSS